MMMFFSRRSFFWGILLVLNTACATARLGEQHFLRLPPQTRVAVVPAANRTNQPDASMILNKAWDEALAKHGFLLVNSDQVVTFAAASALSIRDLEKINPVQLAADLHVQLLLVSDITEWKTQYRVVDAGSRVSGVSRLLDGRTGALMWEYFWTIVDESYQGGDALSQLAGALTTAIIHSATDMPARLANSAVKTSAATLPLPGAPAGAPQ